MSAPAHEVVTGFLAEGLRLNPVLVDMLNEHASHRTERRGCGYTQATRFLSRFINQPRDPLAAIDLSIFQDWPLRETEQLASNLQQSGWTQGWRAVAHAPPSCLRSHALTELFETLLELPARVRRVHDVATRIESRIFLTLLEQVLTRAGDARTDVPGMPTKPDIGSCSQAEEFFLEIAHRRVRRGGSVNVVVNVEGAPIMVEKINLGESHSAIVVAPFLINGVVIPAGGLCALSYRDPPERGRRTSLGEVVPLGAIAQARFLRLTTLAVAPDARARAFSAQVELQMRSDMLSPMSTTIEQLHRLAEEQLASAG